MQSVTNDAAFAELVIYCAELEHMLRHILSDGLTREAYRQAGELLERNFANIACKSSDSVQ